MTPCKASADRERLLCITLSNIGDALMTTPVLETLHRVYPEAAIDIVADRRSSRIFECCPYRGDIIHKNKREGWIGVWRLVRHLRRRYYRVIVDLRTDGLAWLLRGQRRLTRWGARARGPHAVERSYAVIDALSGGGRPPATTVWLDDGVRTFATGALAALPRGRWLALGPGANWEPKIWPLDHFRSLADLLAGEFDGLVILGGKGDVGRAAGLAQGSPLPAINLAGATDLLQAAAVLERCTAFVGNDSGLGHLAAAVGTPTLTVFGPGQPERYHPWVPRADYVIAPDRDLRRLEAGNVAARLRAHLQRLATG